ncbi:hypothetical protein BaRGS_00034622 [Batillaria attramentaria]|uniref:Neurotransmitter-gated ion-channel ligand-binding domain-containing protein n=1 Tax=Batillaria attramentaria TaxID=370345 RepID=A0ABD0JH01_9CAEN
MRRAAHLQYLQYVVLGFLGGVECVTFLEEPHQYRLERTLFSGYKPHLRPVLDPNTTTNITYTLVITAVHELDEMHQTLVHSSYLSLSWMDQLLVWDPGQYGDIRWLEVPTEMIWTPNLMFVNSASDKRSLEPDMSRFAFINSSGRVVSAPFAVRTTSCSMDITFYPFDSQVCVVTLESWSSPESEMNVTDAEVKLDEWYTANSEWKLEEVAVEDVESIFEDCLTPDTTSSSG